MNITEQEAKLQIHALERRCAALQSELAQATARAEQAQSALAELVACKDLHDEYERDKSWRWQHPNPEIRQEYERRKGPAWAAARAALASGTGAK